MLKNNVIRLWKSKNQIIEGVTNSIFKKEDVEQIAKERMSICEGCSYYTLSNDGCMVAGTGPCCNMTKGGCGCSLGFKTRSLSAECEQGYWKSEVSPEEEDLINEKI